MKKKSLKCLEILLGAYSSEEILIQENLLNFRKQESVAFKPRPTVMFVSHQLSYGSQKPYPCISVDKKTQAPHPPAPSLRLQLYCGEGRLQTCLILALQSSFAEALLEIEAANASKCLLFYPVLTL